MSLTASEILYRKADRDTEYDEWREFPTTSVDPDYIEVVRMFNMRGTKIGYMVLSFETGVMLMFKKVDRCTEVCGGGRCQLPKNHSSKHKVEWD